MTYQERMAQLIQAIARDVAIIRAYVSDPRALDAIDRIEARILQQEETPCDGS